MDYMAHLFRYRGEIPFFIFIKQKGFRRKTGGWCYGYILFADCLFMRENSHFVLNIIFKAKSINFLRHYCREKKSVPPFCDASQVGINPPEKVSHGIYKRQKRENVYGSPFRKQSIAPLSAEVRNSNIRCDVMNSKICFSAPLPSDYRSGRNVGYT